MQIKGKVLFLLVLTVCIQIKSLVSSCSYQTDVDLFGNDLYVKYATSADDCCNQCSADASCNAWTYISVTQVCWLKSAVGSVRLGVSQSKTY